MSNARLSKLERHDAILAEIRVNSAIRVSELAKRLNVAGETIRRDLAELGEAGLVSRNYGGATVKPFTYEPSVGERGKTLVEEHTRIGHAAAKRISSGQVVMIDGGSTTFQVARHLAQIAKDVTILTNSLPIAMLLSTNPTFRVTLAPGRLNANEHSVTGEETVDFLRRYNANFAIIGASALSLDGPCEAAPGVAAVKRVMIERAAETILVADHSKFGQRAFEIVTGYASIDSIVTDQEPDRKLRKRLGESRTSVIIA